MTQNNKSPFIVYQDFISPKMCDQIIENFNIKVFNKDTDGTLLKYETYNDFGEDVIFNNLKNKIKELENNYNFEYEGTERMIFQSFPMRNGNISEEPGCQNSKYLRKKWVKIKNIDLTGVLWLNNYQDKPPFDNKTEVYGGKLEFPAYNFSLVPEKGTLVLFPACPHFISLVSPILVGNLCQVRINITVKQPYFYNPADFDDRGWTHWFREYV